MSAQESERPDCQEKVGLKRKPTGPPRLLLGKSTREKPESQRRQRRDKCCEDTPENIDKQEDSPRQETIETQCGETSGIFVTLEENPKKEVHMENKDGMTGSISKRTVKRTFSSLLCIRRRKSEMECNDDGTQIRNPQKSCTTINKAQDTSMNEKTLCDDVNKSQRKGKRNLFFMVWPLSKRSSVTSNVLQGRSKEQGDIQEKPTKTSFKKIFRIFPKRKKAHPPVNHVGCDASKTTHIEISVDANQSGSDNIDIPRQRQLEKEQEIGKCTSETLTFSAEVSVCTNIESGHVDHEQEICPDRDEDNIVLSTTNEEKHPESSNEILQTDSCCSIASDDMIGLNESNKNHIKCRPVITIDRVYTPEEDNQENHVNDTPCFDFLSMNGSWQHLQINSLTNNTLQASDLSLSPELDHSRCNETLLIQTAISMVQAAIRGAVQQLANEQQQNPISLDSL